MVVDKKTVWDLLTLEQIRGVAPDVSAYRGADELGKSGSWNCWGWQELPAPESGQSIRMWAEFPNGQRAVIRSVVEFPTLGGICTCRAARFPCRHLLALLIRFREEHPAFAADAVDVPDWVDQLQVAARHSSPAAPDPTFTTRLEALRAGMADLSLWLDDLIRQGLTGLPKRNRHLWLATADRLADAYAVGAARELQTLSLIPGTGIDWPERLLPRLGRLRLMCEGFSRLDELPREERGDLLAAAGLSHLSGGTRVNDVWQVIGHASEVDGKVTRERVWVWGTASGRWGLIYDERGAGQCAGFLRPVGACLAGELAFSPSAWPLLAVPTGSLNLVTDVVAPNAPALPIGDISGAIAGYGAALALNPWLDRYPVLLDSVLIEPQPAPEGRRWRLRDRPGRVLPLPAEFAHGWQLLALAADKPLAVFGEWDGRVFTPFTLRHDTWRPLSAWKGLS